ncbi:MAG TPA: hypothetical protein VJX67_10760 [Blastocatellia bacterium]|nr:hypothetical protein [Blastocatellia bacterium]
MKSQVAIRERYLRDPLPIRLGGLAANLARIQSFSGHPDHCEVVEGLLDESKLFIEWVAPEAGPQLQAELLELQRQIVQWHRNWTRIWDDPAKRAAVAESAGVWSRNVLERSGLLDQR